MFLLMFSYTTQILNFSICKDAFDLLQNRPATREAQGGKARLKNFSPPTENGLGCSLKLLDIV